jgi:glycosyltransferase involved in cell wall biosynthesis
VHGGRARARRPDEEVLPLPEVSVVVAAHNQADFLGETIESVLAQTFPDWELVVVDDGSTDATPAVAARYAARDARVRCLSGPRQERAAARNRGLAATTAPLVAFLDGDDLWHPDKLARQVTALRADPAAGLCYTVARFIDAGGHPLPIRKPRRVVAGDVFPLLVRGNVLIIASVLVRRACLDRVGTFDAALPVFGCEDWDLWLRVTRHWPVTAVDEELTLYRRHDGNTSWRQVMASALAVVDKTFAEAGTAERARLSRAGVRALHYWYNVPDAGRGAAVPLVLRALREAPATLATRAAAAALVALCLPAAAAARVRR